LVEDVTSHPATRAVVDEYAAWYDRHFDPGWQNVVLTPPDANGDRAPWGYIVPREAADLTRMARCFSKTTFLSAGNLTHTPAYGQLIALGVLCATQEANVSPKQIGDAAAYRELIAATGRFLTFSAGAATIGYRMREDPGERAAIKIVRETDAGLVLSGKIGMHTSPAYAEDVYVGALSGVDIDGRRATFIVPIATPGVTVICRKVSAREANPSTAPLSSRYDELDGQMWLDDVFISWERVFLLDQSPEPVARWLFWHQLYCWLSKAEFTLGLALACTHAMGLTANRADDRLSDRSDRRRADGAELSDRRRARPAVHVRGLLLPQSPPCRGGQHRDAERAAADVGNPADSTRLVLGRRTIRPRSRGTRGGGRARGIVQRRRLHRAAAFGHAPDGVGPCVLGARWPGIGVRIARQWRHAGLARPPAAQL
jgi:hypothetical protein